MAQTKNNTALRNFLKKRDSAYDHLVFNQQYPLAADKLIDSKNDILLKQQELKSKKRLYPLEIASLSEADRNEVLYKREMEAFIAKQELPRRAVQQKYLRIAKKSDADATQYRDKELKKLDQQTEVQSRLLKQKYPENAKQPALKEAIAAYERATKEEDAKIAALADRLGNEKKQKMDVLHAKLEAQNIKLQSEFDTANAQLQGLSTIDESAFGAGNILSIQNLKMYFSGIKAVDNLSFNIKQGDIFGLIGPNGAGKTTLFNCVTQFYKPTEGYVYYRDRFGNLVDLTDYKTSEVIKAGISRTFQNLELVYWLSVLDNLLVGAHAFYRATLADQFLHTAQLKKEEEVYRQRALDLLDRLGILAYKDMPPLGLPYGVLKKVELARTLMSSPRMIILDEPAAGLNDAETEDLAEIIRTIRKDFDCTIFLVEHDMNLVMSICDTVCAISFGKMLAIGTPEEIQNSPLVQEAYLGAE